MGLFYTLSPQAQLIWALLGLASKRAGGPDGSSPDQLARSRNYKAGNSWDGQKSRCERVEGRISLSQVWGSGNATRVGWREND